MQYRKDGSEIATELRHRICMMQSVSDQITLHEGALATEFGVSRTPIRQVLQKLAYERLVETRSGVGTIVSPLVAGDRDRDVKVLKVLMTACATCCEGGDVPAIYRERLSVASAMADSMAPTKEAYLEIRGQLLDISASALPDDILADALRAAHWRHIRWRMAEGAGEDEEARERLRVTARTAAEAAQRNDMSGIYSAMAGQLI
ncbi:GntR family transcriptional regulator [Pseudooceanicola sp. MF1-13]|uniref:GntR family transcriptional regulator n=1 Tax=Pseudooceanicola sp. MF1-13 TaxID=3379095 RepID=UPI003892643D